MKNCKLWISCLLQVFGVLILFSCSKINKEPDNFLYFEEVGIEDGSVIDLVHINGCKEFDTSAWFISKEEKIDYIKMKGQVFCFCIYGPECDMLMAISYRNAKKWFLWDFVYNTDNHDESANIFAERIDTLSHPYEVWFSESEDGRIFEQPQHKIYKQVMLNK